MAIDYQDVRDALKLLAEEKGMSEALQRRAEEVLGGYRHRCTPAPQVSSHGPKSVIFCWHFPALRESMYVTISETGIEQLWSTPERIEKRERFEFKEKNGD